MICEQSGPIYFTDTACEAILNQSAFYKTKARAGGVSRFAKNHTFLTVNGIYNTIFKLFVFQASKKRVKQDLSLAQTVTAAILQQAAEMKNDGSVLVHIRGKIALQ